ncbi:uclacyanin 1-like [Macadamia integrifolia]|uniref:uclacyanin 1-like n=1 Tax=Macadamia integrifolia TaxID=60698 RepID=UPI001C4F9CC1|nr:uclacyanin 1-like [Macadamia integrifolia]XP_042503160.1 uclacyanin 1-like [Macadamia integrifolia]
MDKLRPPWAVKVIILILFSSILFRCVTATNHTVGGVTGWNLASDVKSWASNTVFFTGDNLVFVYTPEHDVIEVGERGYAQCQIRSPIRTHNNGHTVIPLLNPGTRYFVCGKPGHCWQGMKVQVDVLPRPQNVSSSPSTETGGSNAGTIAPIGSNDQVEGPDASPSLRHRRPPQPPRPAGHVPPPPHSRHSPPPPDDTDSPEIHPPPLNPGNPEGPTPNGASAERGGVYLKVAYVVYYFFLL